MKIILKTSTIVLLLLFSCVNWMSGQSKFEFGIGFGINHSQIEDDFRTQAGPLEDQNKGIRFPALFTRVAYKLNNRFHLNSGVGVSWLGALQKDQSARIVTTTVEIPLQVEYNLTKSIHLSSGGVYNYITSINNETDQIKSDVLSSIDTRHQFGLKHGIAYSHKSLELSLSYIHYLTNLFNIPIQANGMDVGTYVSKFRNIQLGIIFRG